jgi:hypothetical protein
MNRNMAESWTLSHCSSSNACMEGCVCSYMCRCCTSMRLVSISALFRACRRESRQVMGPLLEMQALLLRCRL